MMLCIYFGIPRRTPAGPVPSWRGFAYFSASLALIYGALDQGERLDWLNSGVIVAMLAGGVFLFIATCIRRIVQPNPTLNLSFLNSRNTIILALSIFVFKFVHLSVLVLVPGFLNTIRSVPAARNGTRTGVGRGTDVRRGLAGGVARDLYKFQADAGIGTDLGRGRLLDLLARRYGMGRKQF